MGERVGESLANASGEGRVGCEDGGERIGWYWRPGLGLMIFGKVI